MLEFLKPLKNKDIDCITFFEGSKPGLISIEGHQYENRGEKLNGSEVGDMYHIVLVKDHAEDPDKFDHFDQFEAILACPLEYLSNLIPVGFYGILAKKTTTSQAFVDRAVDNMKKML